MPCCASNVLYTHDVIDDVTRSVNRSNLKIAITRSVFIVHHGNKYCHNLWLTGHVSNTLKRDNHPNWQSITVSNDHGNPSSVTSCLMIVALGAGFKDNLFRMNANIVIEFLGYT